MQIIKKTKHIRPAVEKIKNKRGKVGLVPTMGCLHEGHLSLIRRARRECDIVVLSIFVNPLQFCPGEDFDEYPRPLDRDLLLAKEAGVDVVFLPQKNALYPEPFLTHIAVDRLSAILCGRSRPGHFSGVATVVCKLFNCVRPDCAYFGQKDYQQVLIIKQMVRDLNLSVKIRICPIVREQDGVAISSRNVYLSETERKRARVINESLKLANRLMQRGTRNPSVIERKIRNVLKKQVDVVDYVAILSALDLSTIKRCEGKVFVGIAVRVGKTRLIDNRVISKTT